MTTWEPVLTGEQAYRALAAVRDIADALTPEATASMPPSLGSGKAGVALFHLVLGETDRALALLDEAIDVVAEQERFDPVFYGTTLGLSWALSRTARLLGEDDAEDSDVDTLLARLLMVDPWPGHFDLITGLVGLGAYCLERLPRATARESLDRIVAHLAAMAERSDAGAAWFTTPAIYLPRADRYPDGHYDVGFAHGNAGVVAFLAAATRAGVGDAAPLLAEATRWLVALRGKGAQEGTFPSVLRPDGRPEPSRMAWCYGDPGVALALLAAGNTLGDASVVATAREVAMGCAERADTAIVDAGLCHGSAGVAHVFNRLGQFLGDERLLDLARHWYDDALGRLSEVNGHGMLEGSAGLGLALHAAATPAEPWWDFPLLLDATA